MRELASYIKDTTKVKFINVESETQKFELTIKRYLKGWQGQVNSNLNKIYKKSLVKSFLYKAIDPNDIEGIANFRIGDMPQKLAGLAATAAQKGLERAYLDMNTILAWDINMTPLAEYYLQHYEEFSKILSSDLQNRIKQMIGEAIKEGTPSTEVHQKIADIFEGPVIIKVPEKANEAGDVLRRGYEYEMNKDVYTTSVARTEIQRALNNGRVYGYQESQIAKTLRYVANPGACEICLPYNGEIYNVEDSMDLIPRHNNCRCTFIVSEYKDYEEAGDNIDKFDTSKIVSDPNGVGISELLKLDDEECNKVIRSVDEDGPDAALKLLRKLAGEK
jgi:SPP1 gp7 family putative phage head morphogenesis protein